MPTSAEFPPALASPWINECVAFATVASYRMSIVEGRGCSGPRRVPRALPRCLALMMVELYSASNVERGATLGLPGVPRWIPRCAKAFAPAGPREAARVGLASRGALGAVPRVSSVAGALLVEGVYFRPDGVALGRCAGEGTIPSRVSGVVQAEGVTCVPE